LEADPLPIVCIPTTSGTGSEVTPYAVFTDTKKQTKGALSHPGIFPQLALIDPGLAYAMPPPLVVATGLDALTHAVEAFLSTETFPMNDLVALTAIQTVLSSLPAAATHDHEAMRAMSYAAMLGGIAITHASTILPHVMGYPLTVFHKVPHGLAGAVLLPEFLRFLRTHSSVPLRVERLERLFAPYGGVVGYLEGLGVSCRLSSYGVSEEEIATFVRKVTVKGDVKITPATVTEEAIAAIYRASL
jgi:alcohol dehydrogenase class IV